MKKTIGWSILFSLTFLISISASSEGKVTNAQIDSLRKELDHKRGVDKISSQLDLALQVMEKDKSEALKLSVSALNEAKAAKELSLEIHAYFVLGRINEAKASLDISEAYYDTAQIISEASGDNWQKGEILYRKGVIKYSRNEEINALEYFNASLQACRLSNNYKILGSSYSMMGTIFRVNGMYDRAIEYTVNSKLNYEKAGFTEGNAWDAYLLGRIYADLKVPKKALEYFQEALEIYKKQALIDGNMDGVAICYEQMGLLNLENKNLEEAIGYIEKSLKIYSENKSQYGISNARKNLGMIEYSRGNYMLAENHLTESLKVKNEIGDLLNIPTIHEYLGLCLIGRGNTSEGLKSLKRGLELAISNNQKRIQLNIYSKLTEAYLSINDLKNALACQKNQIELQDFLLSGAANIKIEQLQAIYEIDKKNGQIIELEKQNEINTLIIKQHWISQLVMIIGVLIAFIVSVSIYWFYTKIKHKNHELKESNSAKDKFFAIIAHDLRGPTGNLAAFLEHLNTTFNEYSQEELQEIVLSLYKSAENVSLLLDNLLIWAQTQLNKIEYRPEELNLPDIIQSSIKGLKQSADNKQIDIRLEIGEPVFVLADPNMTQTILRNLLSNAIKFSHRGGRVIIRTEVSGKNIATISVIDAGVGIDKASLSRIFDLSNTPRSSGTEDEKSTGLGLVLVKDFVEKNKGKIEINSQENSGTTVSFTLPIVPKS